MLFPPKHFPVLICTQRNRIQVESDSIIEVEKNSQSSGLPQLLEMEGGVPKDGSPKIC